jgi:hypothetical protein
VSRVFRSPRHHQPDDVPYLHRDRRRAYRAEMVKWLGDQIRSGGSWFHLTGKLATDSDQLLHKRLRMLKHRADRELHGKRAPQHDPADLMTGIVLFEDSRDGRIGADGRRFVHFHAIVRAPKGGSIETLVAGAGAFLHDKMPVITARKDGTLVYQERGGGELLIQPIAANPDSIERAVSYAVKELGWKSEQVGRWRFLV